MYNRAEKSEDSNRTISQHSNNDKQTLGFEDNRPETTTQRKLQNLMSNNICQLSVIQRETEVENVSIDQAYKSKGDISQQKMGVQMEAYLDPWNPLHGTESNAFNRHGIYSDSDYNEGDKGATAMHLLNAHLGGLAVDENLFPSHTNKNGQHLKSGETEVKNKVLNLLDANAKGYRVYYKVKFSPPSVLTPENFTKVPLSLVHTYIDKNNNPINAMVEVKDDPNEELGEHGWTNNSSKNVNREDRFYINEDTRGEYASYVETVTHGNDDLDNQAVRMHTHLAHEDKDLMR